MIQVNEGGEVFRGRMFVRQNDGQLMAIGYQGTHWWIFSQGVFLHGREGRFCRFESRSVDPGVTGPSEARERIQRWIGMGFEEIRSSPDAPAGSWDFTILQRLPTGTIIGPCSDLKPAVPDPVPDAPVVLIQATDEQLRAIGITPIYL